MITMTAYPEANTTHDVAACDWDGHRYEARAHSATTELARMLLDAGCPDQPWQSFTPDGTRSLHGPSLHAWAKLVVADNRMRPYRKRPR